MKIWWALSFVFIIVEGRVSLKSNGAHDISHLVQYGSDFNQVVASSEVSEREASMRGFATILGGALAHLTLGTLYCWANFMSYSPMNLRFFDGKEHPGSQPDATLITPFTIAAQCIGVPLGPMLVAKLGASRAMLLGSWIMAAGVYLSSFAKSLKVFALFYSLMFGLGAGLAYTAPMIAGYKWLPKSKGLVSGAILAGFGAGGFFFNLIGTKLANPKGFEPTNGLFPESVYNAFPQLLRKLAIIYASLSFVGSLLVSEPLAKPAAATVESTPGWRRNPFKAKMSVESSAPAAQGLVGVSIAEALKTPQFYLLWVLILASASAGLNVASVYKQFAGTSSALSGDAYLALVGGMGALLNGFGRLFWGLTSDKIGFKTSFTILTVFQAVLHVLYPLSTSSKGLFTTFTSLCYFCLAGTFALMPPAMQRIFGPKNGATIYGLLYSAFGAAAIGSNLFGKALMAKLGWVGVFRTLAALSLAAAALTATLLTPLSSLPSSTVN